jgi:hypothetical protein
MGGGVLLTVDDGKAVRKAGVEKTRQSSVSKVVVHSRSGNVFPGFARWNTTGDELEIINPNGKGETFRLSDVKAVFFVKDFKGDSSYTDVKFLNKQQVSQHLWVRIEFYDGEILEGRVENGTELLNCAALYLKPSDEDSNNLVVCIPKNAIRSFIVLSTE